LLQDAEFRAAELRLRTGQDAKQVKFSLPALLTHSLSGRWFLAHARVLFSPHLPATRPCVQAKTQSGSLSFTNVLEALGEDFNTMISDSEVLRRKKEKTDM
jgi:hypothetical protein